MIDTQETLKAKDSDGRDFYAVWSTDQAGNIIDLIHDGLDRAEASLAYVKFKRSLNIDYADPSTWGVLPKWGTHTTFLDITDSNK